MKTILMTAAALATLAFAGCSKRAADTAAPSNTAAVAPAPAQAEPTRGEPVVPGAPGETQAPAGLYTLDRAHSTMVFRLSHLGFSHYRAQFTRLEGQLNFDPRNPGAIQVSANIDPKSLSLPAPPAGFQDTLLGKEWLDAASHPQITFRSTKVEPVGPNKARVTGDLTLHGVTKPVVLDAVFNGGYAPNAFDGARLGFSASGRFRRSEFGIRTGLPAPGTNMGVGDQVDFTIESEWTSGKPTAPMPAQ